MAAKSVTTLLSQTLRAQVPASQLPITLRPPIGNLYEILSRTPSGGVGLKVHQTRWGTKEIDGSYWLVTRSRFKREGKNGKAWGQLYWKGKLVSEREERIRGSLKYTWMEGPSIALSVRLRQPASETLAPAATSSTVRHFIA